MPGLYKDEGVVLRSIKLGEADRIVTLFTRWNGKVRAVAKGVRKTKSRFGARLEPFSRVHLMMYRGRDLDTITSVDIITSFDALRADYKRLAYGAALTELVEKVTPDRERAVPVYSLLLGGLHALAATPSDSILPAFYVKLLSLSGYHPQLTRCASCGAGDTEAFSSAMGGAVCVDCAGDDRSARALGSDRIELIDRLLGAEFGEPADRVALEEITAALVRYAEYHLERPLRSAAIARAC